MFICVKNICLSIYSHFIEKSITELQYQYCNFEIPTFFPENGGEQENGTFITLHHFDSWRLGENFFFIDFNDFKKNGTNTYGEFYPSFSLAKITGLTKFRPYGKK